jgi:hypothetical protein
LSTKGLGNLAGLILATAIGNDDFELRQSFQTS